MGSLIQSFREKVGKDIKHQEASFDVGYSTGYLALDFNNGTMVVTPKGNYYSVGIVDGSAVTFIGRSGCGKTTLALQIASNIVRPFENSDIYYDDIEGGSTARRREILTGYFGQALKDKMVYRNANINTENLYERINELYRLKTGNRKTYEYDTGLFDTLGERIFKFIPTVYMLDSLALLTPEKIEEEDELSGQMGATAIAKSNTAIFKRIIPKLKGANIIMFTINHILDDISINPMQKKKSQVAWLKQGETLPGGKAATYLANNMFRLDDATKLKETEGLGIHGIIVNVDMVKSRTNSAGKAIPLLFDASIGFDPELSLYTFLKEKGRINAKGAYMSFDVAPDTKFTQKTFKEKLHTDVEFMKIFQQVCSEELRRLVSINSFDNETKVYLYRSSFNSNIMDMMNSAA